MTTKQPDWEAIERAYRAGLLSIREIVSTQSIIGGKRALNVSQDPIGATWTVQLRK
ncbi:hypothetical protein [Pseudomonas sp. LB3P38]|uniref:hypothetical protein n=1 Tax=Pseudomonas lyxosi TaxID=3398358 RepID=UPI0039EE220B